MRAIGVRYRIAPALQCSTKTCTSANLRLNSGREHTSIILIIWIWVRKELMQWSGAEPFQTPKNYNFISFPVWRMACKSEVPNPSCLLHLTLIYTHSYIYTPWRRQRQEYNAPFPSTRMAHRFVISSSCAMRHISRCLANFARLLQHRNSNSTWKLHCRPQITNIVCSNSLVITFACMDDV